VQTSLSGFFAPKATIVLDADDDDTGGVSFVSARRTYAAAPAARPADVKRQRQISLTQLVAEANETLVGSAVPPPPPSSAIGKGGGLRAERSHSASSAASVDSARAGVPNKRQLSAGTAVASRPTATAQGRGASHRPVPVASPLRPSAPPPASAAHSIASLVEAPMQRMEVDDDAEADASQLFHYA